MASHPGSTASTGSIARSLGRQYAAFRLGRKREYDLWKHLESHRVRLSMAKDLRTIKAGSIKQKKPQRIVLGLR